MPSLLDPHVPDESTLSYASRLAHLYGRALTQFCFDMGLPQQTLTDGDVEATSRLADLGGSPPGQLLWNAPVNTRLHEFVWRGEVLGWTQTNRFRQRVCPRRCRPLAPILGQPAPQIPAVLALVAAEFGVSVVPASMRQAVVTGVRYIDFSDVRIVANLAIASRPDEKAIATRNFVDLVRHRSLP